MACSASSSPAAFSSAWISCCLFLRGPMWCFFLASIRIFPLRPEWSTPGSSSSSSAITSCLVKLSEMPLDLAISLSSATVSWSSPPGAGTFFNCSASCWACLSAACFSARRPTSSCLVRSSPIWCSLSLAFRAAPARSAWLIPGSTWSRSSMKLALVRAIETPFCFDSVCSCLTVRPERSPI